MPARRAFSEDLIPMRRTLSATVLAFAFTGSLLSTPASAGDCTGAICVEPGSGGGGGVASLSAADKVDKGDTFSLNARAFKTPRSFTFQVKNNGSWQTIRTVNPSGASHTTLVKAPTSTGKKVYRVVAKFRNGTGSDTEVVRVTN